jgi:hypothetical protein
MGHVHSEAIGADHRVEEVHADEETQQQQQRVHTLDPIAEIDEGEHGDKRRQPESNHP